MQHPHTHAEREGAAESGGKKQRFYFWSHHHTQQREREPPAGPLHRLLTERESTGISLGPADSCDLRQHFFVSKNF